MNDLSALPFDLIARSKAFWITCLVVTVSMHLMLHAGMTSMQRSRERLRDHPAYATAKVIRKEIRRGRNGPPHYLLYFKFKPKEVKYNEYPRIDVTADEFDSHNVGEDVQFKYDPKNPEFAMRVSDVVHVVNADGWDGISTELLAMTMALGVISYWWVSVALSRTKQAASVG